MNISKLLLSTTLIMMSCSSIYAAEGTKTMYYDMLTSSYENLKDYKINNIVEIDNPNNPGTNIPNPLYGSIYDERSDGNYYLVDENNNKFFDLQTRISTIMSDWKELINPEVGNRDGTLNLIVKSFNDNIYNTRNTYTLTAQKDIHVDIYLTIGIYNTITNLVIPQNTTLDCDNILLEFNTNSNILILGTVTNKNQTYNVISHYLYLCYGEANIILGPQATYDYNNINIYSPIRYSSNNMNCILYPGCEIKTNNIVDNLELAEKDFLYCTIHQVNGNLYLNRYVTQKDTNKLVGTVHFNSHIVYPTTMEDINKDENEENRIKEEYKLQKAGDSTPKSNFSKTSYFHSLYWRNTNHTYNSTLGTDRTYHFEEPIPIVFDDETKVLKLNPENELAKYDVKLWNQCKVDSGKYSFKEFVNIEANKDKYINTNTIEDLFMDGKIYNNTGLLQNMPNEIFVGLIDNKNIKIKESDSKNISLLGDNSGYNGTMTIPDNITNIYLKTISKINNIKYKNKTYANDKIPGVKFNYIDQNNSNNYISNCKHIWDLAIKGNELTEPLSNNKEVAYNTIILKDSGEIKTNTIKIIGDNSEFKGIIITPPDVKEVIFGKNSFVRTVNINGKPLKYIFTDNNNVTDYNDYSKIESKNGAKVTVKPNNGATYFKNGRKTLNINTYKINVHKYGSLTFKPGTKLSVGKK